MLWSTTSPPNGVPPAMDDPRFSDEEVREILGRAVALRPSEALASGEGVSLSELRAVAEEVGIDPARLEQAALSVVRDRTPTPGGRLLGYPRLLGTERAVPGDLDPDRFPEILATIRRAFGHAGEANEIRGSLEWSSRSETGDRHVMVSTVGENTMIRASSNLSNLALVTFLPASIIGAMFAAISFVQTANVGNEVGMILSVLLMPALYTTLRTIFSRLGAAESRKLERVVDEIAQVSAPDRD